MCASLLIEYGGIVEPSRCLSRIVPRPLFIFALMAPLVDDPQIAAATLHNPLPLYLHAYVWPFTIIWPIFLRYYLTVSLYDKYIQSSEWTFVWCGTIITAQSLVWLSTNWNVKLKSLFTSVTANTIEEAHLIKVHPVANAGSSEICRIVRDNVSSCVKLSDLSNEVTGRGETEHVLHFSKAPVSVQYGAELLCTAYVRY